MTVPMITWSLDDDINDSAQGIRGNLTYTAIDNPMGDGFTRGRIKGEVDGQGKEGESQAVVSC